LIIAWNSSGGGAMTVKDNTNGLNLIPGIDYDNGGRKNSLGNDAKKYESILNAFAQRKSPRRRRSATHGVMPELRRKRLEKYIQKVSTSPPFIVLACMTGLAGGWGMLAMLIIAFG
jgi:hypothetical protein